LFLTTDFKTGDPLPKVVNARNLNRIGNILMSLRVVGGHLDRSFSAEGTDWLLVIDGANDTPTPDGIYSPTSDRLFAVDSLSKSRLGAVNFTGADSTGYNASRDLHVRHDVCADSVFSGVAYRQIRQYLQVSDTTAAPTQALCRTAAGRLRWVTLDSACPAP
jgi:hypothetical protein